MPSLYCDESGYTGTDLLSESQPFLVIASLLLGDREIDELAEPLDKATQAQELKCSNLLRRPTSRKALLAFVERLDTIQPQIRFHLTHKRYALLGKVLDMLVEPVFRAKGVDFYADGMNLAYLNTWYVITLDTRKEQDTLLRNFLAACRQSSAETLDSLANAILALAARSKQLEELCSPLLFAVRFRQIHAPDSLSKSDLALMFTCVVSLVRQWNEELPEAVAIIADASKELFHSRDMLELFADPAMPGIFEATATRVIGLPLRVSGLNLVDSRTHRGVQLADVAAGVVNHVQIALNDPTKVIPGFTQDVSKIVTRWPRMLQIIPEAKFTPEQLGRKGFNGSKLLDAAAAALERREGP